MGKRMASFPLDPPQARAILESAKHSSTSSLLSVLSLLSTSGNILIESKDRETSADARMKFRHRSGDHLTMLNALRAYEEVLAGDTSHGSDDEAPTRTVTMDADGEVTVHRRKGGREWCKANFLNERSLKEALNIRKQLRDCCRRENIEWKETNKLGAEKEEEGILKSLLSGLWQNTATITPNGTYRQVIGQQVRAGVEQH